MAKILVIDEIRDLQDYYQDILKEARLESIYLTKFDSVLFTLSADSFAAVIIDPVRRIPSLKARYHLDIEEGMKLIKAIKIKYPDIPVIVNSALDTLSEYFDEYQAFPDRYVLKSFDESELISNLIDCLCLETLPVEEIAYSPKRKAKIFISYAKEDFPKAYAIYEILRQKEFSPWIDSENLLPGQDWQLEIDKALEKCNFFVACLSNISVSKEGYVQKELKKGLDILDKKPEGSIYLIPVRLDNCKTPKRMESLQWCNLLDDSGGIEKLLKAIEFGCRERGLIR
ncbi:MAG TPA: TIR domain-containing protein [Desulfatiglandales bacterium]|nr:TIR domain-containing protein [Desulfatiglandales bacterium]